MRDNMRCLSSLSAFQRIVPMVPTGKNVTIVAARYYSCFDRKVIRICVSLSQVLYDCKNPCSKKHINAWMANCRHLRKRRVFETAAKLMIDTIKFLS